MADYAVSSDDDRLFPESGYAVIAMDEFIPPDSEDFVTVLSTFEDTDFELPVEKNGYTYWVHDADGETYVRREWPPDE